MVKVDLRDRPRLAYTDPSYNHHRIVFPHIIATIRSKSQRTRVGRKLNTRHGHLNVMGTELGKLTSYFEGAGEPFDVGDASYKSFVQPSRDARCVADLNAVGGMICGGCENTEWCPDRLFRYVGFQQEGWDSKLVQQ